MEQVYHKNYTQNKNGKFNYLIGPNFQKLHELFVLSFKNRTDRTFHSNIVYLKLWLISEKQQKAIEITNGNDAGAGCLLDYSYLNNQCKWIAIDLSKQDLGANKKKNKKPLHEFYRHPRNATVIFGYI